MTSIRKAKKARKKSRELLINAIGKHPLFSGNVKFPLDLLTDSCMKECGEEKYTWNVLSDGKIMHTGNKTPYIL